MLLLGEFAKHAELSGLSRSQIKLLIERGAVTIGGRKVLKSGAAVKPGVQVAVEGIPASSSVIEPWDHEIPILFEDESLLVINKPPGISMHPGAGQPDKTILNALWSHLGSQFGDSGSMRAGIVHRLDKDTTGAVVIAKNVEAQNELSRQFAKREVKKIYLALALSTPRSKRILNREDSGVIEAGLGRDSKNRLKMAVKEEGRHSVTHWKVVERMGYGALLEIDLKTGRTHQIRVHLNHIHSPVIGDPTYGDFSMLPTALKRAANEFGRQALHASNLEFRHPARREEIRVEAPVPKDMEKLIDAFRNHRYG